MVTHRGMKRRGLPRRPGGEPWPSPGSAPERLQVRKHVTVAGPVDGPASGSLDSLDSPPGIATTAAMQTTESALYLGRRGFPRVPGGEPCPSALRAITATAGIVETSSPTAKQPAPEPFTPEHAQESVKKPAAVPGGSAPLRRGLPRVVGNEPWPAMEVPPNPKASPTPAVPETKLVESSPRVAASVVSTEPAATPLESVVAASEGPLTPMKSTLRVSPKAFSSREDVPPPEPNNRGSAVGAQRARKSLVGGVGFLVAAALLVLVARWFVSLGDVRDFLVTYSGESHLPDTAPVGIPGWLAWQHFFNTFFMVLIIRTGWQARADKRPRVFWTPRGSKNGHGKISLSLWFHQFLDVLWLVNGLVFVVLLFATGQWMRVVPTSWDVFPNAVSAALQYLSLNWPTENGWVNYNSLQVIAYFTTIFVAAPLAAITGIRMSGFWPKNARRLNKVYTIEWARAVHFPVMLYFTFFIVVHVTLVVATGALRNLNHMYGGQDSVNWVGFWVFFGSLVLITAGWFAAKPIVLAPLAQIFGKVSGR
ncbi:cytochrome b/b6 domain-containing protein [Arthrobacter sp. S39]|nr:cytochrome b/b6 domain-containing protein [Arthrobacter sp. S39]